MLVRDTRVTNHGYRDGKPTPRQSVLQKGQLVLVDRYGVPRVRCECGNPLTTPKAVKTTPRYAGPRWPDFDPTVIVVVQPTTVIISDFLLVDIDTGDPFERPFGTEGIQDAVRRTTKWKPTVELTYDYGQFIWTADVILTPDGQLSGTGQAGWHANGYTWTNTPDNRTGTWTAEVFYPAGVDGVVDETATGRVLRIDPAPDAVKWTDLVIRDDVGPNEEQRASVASQIPGWMIGFFIPLDLPAVGYGTAYATVNWTNNQGSATITAVE